MPKDDAVFGFRAEIGEGETQSYCPICGEPFHTTVWYERGRAFVSGASACRHIKGIQMVPMLQDLEGRIVRLNVVVEQIGVIKPSHSSSGSES